MNLRLLALTLVSCLLPSFAHSQAQPAVSTPAVPSVPAAADPAACTRLQFEVIPFTHTEDYSTSIQAIGDQQVSGNAHNSSSQGFGLGMVRAERNVQTTIARAADGCRDISVQLAYINNILFVGRELRANNCAFEHVRSHERHHIDLYTDFMANTVPRRLEEVRESLVQQIASLDDKAATAALEKRLYPLLREVKPLHDEYDSDDEYQLNSRVCGGIIRKIVKGLR